MTDRTTVAVVMTVALTFALTSRTLMAAPAELTDQDITVAVQTKLERRDAVPDHQIDVSTTNGIVTLTGLVNRYDAKAKAGSAAESVKGVLAVVNMIKVQQSDRSDTRIRGDIILSLATDPVTESYQINVNVKNGAVTLTGSVDSYSEMQVAQKIAQDVAGVTDVDNRLRYQLVTDRSDSDIESDVRYRLRSDASIDAGLVDVIVQDGEVTLSGTVGSALESREAEEEAWKVRGVNSVINKLQVKWWLDAGKADWSDGWADEDMQRAIEYGLATNTRVNAYNVLTMVQDGVATLTGTVDNLKAKWAAGNEARDTMGVWRVKNYLRVRPEQGLRTDTELASDVREALRRNPYVDRYEITINVYNGKAFLTGIVSSAYMKQQAAMVTAGVRGIMDIQNNLQVDLQRPVKTDKEIKQDIEEQLWWSPFVHSEDITVEVHSGVATLLGTVEDWDELVAARDNAREGGATKVISQLKMEYGPGSKPM